MIWGIVITVTAVALVFAGVTLASIGLLIGGEWVLKKTGWSK